MSEQELLNIIGRLLGGTVEAIGYLTLSDYARAKAALVRTYEEATGKPVPTPDPGIRGLPELCRCGHTGEDHRTASGGCAWCDCQGFTGSPEPALPQH